MQAALARQPLTSTTERINLIDAVREQLENHPHFRGRLETLSIDQRGKTLYLSGQLPTFYLKQLVQEIIRRLPGVQSVRNEIDVISPYGVSSEPAITSPTVCSRTRESLRSVRPTCGQTSQDGRAIYSSSCSNWLKFRRRASSCKSAAVSSSSTISSPMIDSITSSS